ncbi:hypothetical protein D3C73_1094450 [compost metagenome]
MIILANAQADLSPQRLGADHKRAGTDDMARITELVIAAVQGAERNQARTNGGGALQEAGRRVLEVKLDG